MLGCSTAWRRRGARSHGQAEPAAPMRTTRFLGGLATGYLNQVLVLVVGLWLTPFLLRHLGTTEFGLWVICLQLLGWLMLLDVGTVALLPRELATALGLKSGQQAAVDRVGHALRLTVFQSLVLGVAAAALWLLLPADWDGARPALRPVLVALVCLYPLRVFPSVLQGAQDLSFLGLCQLVAWGLGTAVTVGAVLLGQGVVSLAWGWIAQQLLVGVLAGLRVVSRHRRLLAPPHASLTWPLAWGWVRRGLWVSVNQIAVLLVSGADVLLVGKLMGVEAAVVYTCTGKLVTILVNFPRSLLDTALPGLSQMRVSEGTERLVAAFTSLTQAVLLFSGAIAVVILGVNQGFVGWWVGSDKYAGFAPTACFVLNMMLRHWTGALGLASFCFGDERRIAVYALLDGLVSTLVAILLIPRVGFVGGPLALLIGVSVTSLPSHLFALRDHMKVGVSTLVLQLAPWAARVGAIALFATWVSRQASRGFLAVALVAAAVGSLYVLVEMPVALRPPLGSYVRPRLTSLTRRFFPHRAR